MASKRSAGSGAATGRGVGVGKKTPGMPAATTGAASRTAASGGIGARRTTRRGEREGSAATQGSGGPRGAKNIGNGAEGGSSSAATSGGIGAKADRSGIPAASAARSARVNRGRSIGTGNAQSATGDGFQTHFGIGGQGGGSGSSRPSSQRRSRSSRVGANTTGVPTVQDLSDYKPRTTYADSTVKRGDGRKSPTKPKRMDPDNDGDNDASPSGDTDHDYWSPDGKQLKPLPGQSSNATPRKKAAEPDTDDMPPKVTKKSMVGKQASDTGRDTQLTQGRRTANSVTRRRPADDYASMGVQSPANHLADSSNQKFPKGGIIKPSRKGLFTAKAKAAGMSVQQYAAHVLAAKKGTFDPATVRQANFARNFGGGR